MVNIIRFNIHGNANCPEMASELKWEAPKLWSYPRKACPQTPVSTFALHTKVFWYVVCPTLCPDICDQATPVLRNNNLLNKVSDYVLNAIHVAKFTNSIITIFFKSVFLQLKLSTLGGKVRIALPDRRMILVPLTVARSVWKNPCWAPWPSVGWDSS